MNTRNLLSAVIDVARSLGLTRLYWSLRRLYRRGRRLAGRVARRLLPRKAIPGLQLGPAVVTGGGHIDAEIARTLPVRLVVALEEQGDMADLLNRVAALQVASLAFRPVFVTCSDAFGALRTHGYLFEYVVGRDDWVALGHDKTWEDYVEERLVEIRSIYQPDTVVVVTGHGSSGGTATDALLTAPYSRG